MKKKYERAGSLSIEVEYDETNYNVEFFKGSNANDLKSDKIVFRRKSDNSIVHIFDGNVTFICQTYNKPAWTPDELGAFAVCKVKDHGEYEFKHYIETRRGLKLENSFETSHIFLSHSKVGDNSFIISNNSSQFIYNLNRTSDRYAIIYNFQLERKEEKVVKDLGENILMVVMNKSLGYYEDNLFFGINPDNFKIETPIWSEIQERAIPIYTEEEVMNYAKNSKSRKFAYYSTPWLETNYDVCGQVTIEAEVVDYLKQLNNQIKPLDFIEKCSEIKKVQEKSNTRKRIHEEN